MKNIIIAIFILLNLGLVMAEGSTNKSHIKSHTTTFKSKQVITKGYKSLSIADYVNSEKKYDSLFKKWTNTHAPFLNYKLLKAVCSIESVLDPKAKSKEGALGLCQIMPNTWHGISKNIGVPKYGYSVPSHSIQVAAYYFGNLDNFWKKRVNAKEQIKFLLASYNAGEGNILKAKKLCKQDSYKGITMCLSKITSKKSATQTLAYVDKVLDLYSVIN